MQRTMISLLFAGSTLAFGQPGKADPASVEKTILQLERDWVQVGTNKANIEKDTQTLGRIVADDWVGIDYLGHAVTKAQAIANLKSGAASIQSIQLGEMKVRVLGDTAIVTGSDTEKSMYKGKDSSGKYVWTDIFVNRNGRWQAAASHSTKLEK